MRAAYINSLLAAARAQHWTAADVEAMTYAQVAAACGVKIEANGDSPADFFFVNVRARVAKTLADEEGVAAQEARRQQVVAALSREGVDGDVLADADGNIVIGPKLSGMVMREDA